MADLYRNPLTGDIALTDTHQVRLTEDDEETMQRLRSRLAWWAGEWFANPARGVPYRRDILRKNPDLQVVKSVLRAEITSDPGVAEVTRLDVSVDTVSRDMTARFEARLVSGGTVEADIPLRVMSDPGGAILVLDDGTTVV